MSQHPINLAARFALELITLACFAVWGWHLHGAILFRAFAAIAAPVAAAVVWGAVGTSRDVVRSTTAPIMVSGAARLAVEIVIFAIAAVAMYSAGYRVLAFLYAAAVIVQSAMSWDRWQRLLASPND